MNNITQYKILQLRLRELIFQRCPCKGWVMPSVGYERYRTGGMFCKYCEKIVDNVLYNYKFEITVFDVFENVVHDLSLYDKVGESFIGCSPEQLIQYIESNDHLLDKLEEVGRGLYVEVETYPTTKTAYSSKKVKSITPVYHDNLTLIDIFNSHK